MKIDKREMLEFLVFLLLFLVAGYAIFSLQAAGNKAGASLVTLIMMVLALSWGRIKIRRERKEEEKKK